MKQLEIVLPPKHPLNTKVKVELTLEEVALIRELIGKQSTSSAEDLMLRAGYDVKYTGNGVDLPHHLYKDAGAILDLHGYIVD